MIKSFFSIALMCTASSRIPAGVSANHGPKNANLVPERGGAEEKNVALHCPRWEVWWEVSQDDPA